ncbi:MAG: hypothetical protein NC818_06400 [Candidatus Omnitrophica bacterium]|nr:hypothetical protein [Candidatus Omnitrophota bacterium]
MLDKKKLNLIAGVLIVVFILMLFPSLAKIKKHSKRAKKPAKTASLPAKTTPSVSEKELREYFAQLGLVRNPFTLGGKISKREETSEKKSQTLHLSAIVWDKIQPLAIINNQVLGVGEVYENFKIISIEKEKVVVNKEGETVELTISPLE